MSSSPPRRSVFLVGFMATGKTSVGRELAGRLGLPFIDLDDMIEGAAGKPVRAIFADHGEEHFRRLEAAALAEVVAGPSAVVATGGGAPCHGDGLAVMREHGLVVALTAPFQQVVARAGDPASRPLLAGSRDAARELFERRAAIYRQAHFGVRTEHRRPGEIAAEIDAVIRMMERIPDYALVDGAIVPLGRRSYPVLVTPGSLTRVGELARRRLGSDCHRLGLVTDDNVGPLYADSVVAALSSEGFEVTVASVAAGETAKQVEPLVALADQMIAAGLDRRSAIVALGGGVVGDLAGFLAASLFRGISWIQVPTTVVAMVDASIGGKTGIDLAAGKNLLGAFWQPSLVLGDPEVLATLPARERRAAFGELVKYALLDGEELYQLVDQLAGLVGKEWPEPGAGDGFEVPAELTRVICRCVAIKSWIVSRDERERSGERALLNLGHTVGHALEVGLGYGRLLHGEAVALGLLAACRVSARLGQCPEALEQRVATTLARAGLDIELDRWLGTEVEGGGQVLGRLFADKKRAGDRIGMVTLRDVGSPSVTELGVEEISRILRR